MPSIQEIKIVGPAAADRSTRQFIVTPILACRHLVQKRATGRLVIHASSAFPTHMTTARRFRFSALPSRLWSSSHLGVVAGALHRSVDGIGPPSLTPAPTRRCPSEKRSYTDGCWRGRWRARRRNAKQRFQTEDAGIFRRTNVGALKTERTNAPSSEGRDAWDSPMPATDRLR